MTTTGRDTVGWYIMLDLQAVCSACAASPDAARRVAGYDDDHLVIVNPVTLFEARDRNITCRVCGRPLHDSAPPRG